ncbi:ribosome small subunit-dependent GTPase A [Anaerosporobacter faecicola]|uniref:ribosome small subunit-dependent GTPase A n=1 Tax=Anaerosporobacter faecicola TaxID=2718714 RepID=UPI00143BC187|nr:ribosome small subunit-dependent GTPase A [Anaerosporobacter faecicola]
MQGKIVKGIAGFYYIHVPKHGVYECKAKGIFRNQKIKPLVGDNVRIEELDKEKKLGNIVSILPRSNELIRPAVANVDQALVIFAAANPDPNLNLLDRFLIMMNKQNVETYVCFNKRDIVSQEEQRLLEETYRLGGYHVFFTSALQGEGLQPIRDILAGKTTVLAGPSGVGKSSMINNLIPSAQMEVGSISEKIKRGKHTTRHSELFAIDDDSFLFDTPGFSSLYIDQFEKEELRSFFPEFLPYEEYCRFQGCAHINEPQCGVKQALSEGKISKTRYENYLLLYNELKEKKKY